MPNHVGKLAKILIERRDGFTGPDRGRRQPGIAEVHVGRAHASEGIKQALLLRDFDHATSHELIQQRGDLGAG